MRYYTINKKGNNDKTLCRVNKGKFQIYVGDDKWKADTKLKKVFNNKDEDYDIVVPTKEERENILNNQSEETIINSNDEFYNNELSVKDKYNYYFDKNIGTLLRKSKETGKYDVFSYTVLDGKYIKAWVDSSYYKVYDFKNYDFNSVEYIKDFNKVIAYFDMIESISLGSEDEEDDDLEIKEEDILSMVEDDFDYGIRTRGEDYFESGKVLKCIKNGYNYIATVEGSHKENYTVTVSPDYGHVNYGCTCPYEYPCKHEYAVFLAIDNKKYTDARLLPEVEEKIPDIKEIIEKISSSELKEYLVNHGLDIDIVDFKNHFRKYLPKQKYEFYYNNLFNSLLLNKEVEKNTEVYLDRIKQYIDSHDFIEGFKIIKSIIEAYKDSDEININNYFIDILPKLGMFLRVIYRSSDKLTKDSIKKYVLDLKKNNYYNNLYLEDIIVLLEREFN